MALPPVEILSFHGDDIFVAGDSFGKTYREFNPTISDYLEDKLMYHAEALHKIIGLKGVSRTDFRLTDDGTIYALDVNAMPNMDPEKSILPALCIHHDVKISDLINRMIVNTLNVDQKDKVRQVSEKPIAVS